MAKPSFRGVQFEVDETGYDSGRRNAVHEFVQYDKPVIEDLGRKAATFNITGYVVGSDWESRRDKLKKALEQYGPGKLVHPDFGTIDAAVQSFSIRENKAKARRRADFEITFVEPGTQKSPISSLDSRSLVRTTALSSLAKLKAAFISAYNITTLPQYVADYAISMVSTYVNQHLTQVVDVISAANLLLSTDVTSPTELATNIMGWTNSYGKAHLNDDGTPSTQTQTRTRVIPVVTNSNDIVIKEMSEPMMTSHQAYHSLLNISTYSPIPNPGEPITNSTLRPLSTATPTRIAQKQNVIAVQQLIQQSAAVETTVVASYMDFSSYDDAQLVWNEVISVLDTLLATSADTGNDIGYSVLRSVKSQFLSDIRTRAPSLTRVVHKSFDTPTPSLCIAYDMYEDIDRETEIIERNKITHPGFAASDALELLAS
jgi:prophage DNA circulation protein